MEHDNAGNITLRSWLNHPMSSWSALKGHNVYTPCSFCHCVMKVATIVLSVILSVVFARTLADCFASQGKPFEVPTGNLGFTVILFTTCAVVAIVILLLRRFFCGGELGGPRLMKLISAAVLCFLWLIYVLLSSMQSYSIIDVDIGGG